jgi:hypothetical protein
VLRARCCDLGGRCSVTFDEPHSSAPGAGLWSFCEVVQCMCSNAHGQAAPDAEKPGFAAPGLRLIDAARDSILYNAPRALPSLCYWDPCPLSATDQDCKLQPARGTHQRSCIQDHAPRARVCFTASPALCARVRLTAFHALRAPHRFSHTACAGALRCFSRSACAGATHRFSRTISSR